MKHLFYKSYFNAEVRIKTWRKLGTLLKNNVGIEEALSILRDRYVEKKHPLSHVFTAILNEVRKGQPLDIALFSWVPQEEIMLIRGGQKSSDIPSALFDCVDLITAKKKIVSSLIAAISYPLLLLSLFIVLLLTVALYVMPELALISNPELWDGAAAVLYKTCSFVASATGLITFLLLTLTVFISIFAMPYWTGSIRVKFDCIPPWSIYRLITGSVWLFTVATLLRANMQLDLILTDMLGSKVLRPWLYERVEMIKERYRTGGNLGTILKSIDMAFPDSELVEDLAVYAMLPGFDENLYSIAKEWLNEGVEKIQQQAQVLNSILIVGILAVLCGLGVSIGSMQQQLNNSMGAM